MVKGTYILHMTAFSAAISNSISYFFTDCVRVSVPPLCSFSVSLKLLSLNSSNCVSGDLKGVLVFQGSCKGVSRRIEGCFKKF